MSARLEAWVHRMWAGRGPAACLLSPLSLVFRGIAAVRRSRTRAERLPVPVVVVGNIYVGGTGKTPVTIALVRELAARGWTPGIISRGFGREEAGVREVRTDAAATEVGDEPLLIARETGAPVVVGRKRLEAGRRLLELHPEVDVIVSDDGLQHYALGRDVELAVIGARGLGNGWVLPAGPLREPPSRLDEVDAIVLNTPNAETVSSRTPRFVASSCFGPCTQFSTGQTADIDRLSAEIEEKRWKPLAAAGIAAPGRFFAMIRGHDIECAELPLSDHYDFSENPFAGRSEDIIFITGKDAVKCARIPAIADDPRIWVVGLEVKLDGYLIDFVSNRIHDTWATLGRDTRRHADPVEDHTVDDDGTEHRT